MTRLLTRDRFRRVASFTTAQVGVQLLGFGAGIVLVRSMDPTQYGHYTLGTTMVALASVLMDLGVSTAVLARGGALHADRPRLAALVGDAQALLRWMTGLGALALVPAFAVLLARQMPGREAIAIASLAVGGAVLTVFNAVMISTARLRGHAVLQQRLEVLVQGFKLCAIAAATLALIDAQMALGINLLAAGAMFLLLRRYLSSQLAQALPATGAHTAGLLGFVARQAPNSIYYCLSGQITVWLVGLLGNADRVGQLGALGRLGAVFIIIGSLVAAFAQPHVALATTRRALVQAFVSLSAFFALLTFALVAAAEAAPQAMLWILGPRYAGLRVELVWMVLAGSLGAWAAALYSMSAARDWVPPARWMVPSGIAAIALGAHVLDVSTVLGGFMLSTLVAGTSLVVTAAYVVRRLGLERDDASRSIAVEHPSRT